MVGSGEDVVVGCGGTDVVFAVETELLGVELGGAAVDAEVTVCAVVSADFWMLPAGGITVALLPR